MKTEIHPWKKALTIGTIITACMFTYLSITSKSFGLSFLEILLAGLLMWGATWSLNISDGFKKWSTLPERQKSLCTIIMFPGFYMGIALIVVIAAMKAQLSRNN
jgi:hypothetical protein